MMIKKIILLPLLFFHCAFAYANFQTVPVTDNFDRTNEGPPPSASWTSDPFGYGATGHKVSSNTCIGTDVSDNHTKYNTIFPANSEVYVTVTTKGGTGSEMALGLRYDNGLAASLNTYELNIFINAGADTWTLRKIIAGATTDMTSTTSEVSNGDVVGFSMVGSTFTAYQNGNVVATTSDTAITSSGRSYLYSSTTAWVFDNYGVGIYRGGETTQ